MSRKFNSAKSFAVALVPAALALGVAVACASNVDVNINVGAPPLPIIVPAPIVPPPMPYVSIEQDVDFVFPAQLGFYVAVGVPYDLFFVQNSYYLCRDGRWFRAPGSHGPWVSIQHRALPPGLRRHDLERIRSYRNAEYDVYRRDHDHYRGKHFMTGKEEWKEQRKAEKEYRKEGKHEEKEFRKEQKHEEKEDKKAEKEERKHHKHDND